MRNLHRGHVPGVSGEIMFVPRPFRYLAENWDLATLESGEPDTFSSHSAPWAHLARIPMILWGEHLQSGDAGTDEAVDAAQLAPTYARILGLKKFESEGRPLPGLEYEEERPAPKSDRHGRHRRRRLEPPQRTSRFVAHHRPRDRGRHLVHKRNHGIGAVDNGSYSRHSRVGFLSDQSWDPQQSLRGTSPICARRPCPSCGMKAKTTTPWSERPPFTAHTSA